MSKAKISIISVLSLLIVLAPVSSVLAETEGKEGCQNNSPQQVENLDSVFSRLEKAGGEETSDAVLSKAEGEGLLGAIIGGLIGLGVAIAYGVTHHHGPARIARDSFYATAAGVGAGAAVPEP